MLEKNIIEKLTVQLGREFKASYLYLEMSAWFEERGWNGFAKWMDRQYEEERGHAMKIYRYLLDQGASIRLPDISIPDTSKLGSVLEVFEKTLEAEQDVSKSYSDLMTEVKSANDHATVVFLQWFITEQIEEEATVNNIIDRIKIASGSKEALLLIDKELESGEGHEEH